MATKQKVVNRIAKILRAHDASTKTARAVAKEIAEAIPWCPETVWVCATEIENTGRDENVFLTAKSAFNHAAELMEGWVEAEEEDTDEWRNMSARVTALLAENTVDEAIMAWNDYSDRCLDNDYWIAVFETPLHEQIAEKDQ